MMMTERTTEMKVFKRVFCVVLALSMFALCACGKAVTNDESTTTATQTKYTTPAGLAKKSETVYVNLDNSGKATQTIVSDWIHTTSSKVYVNDVTNLSEIQNIKDDSVPDVDGQNLKWYMDSTDLYYQGKSSSALPLEFSLTYYLNGKEVSAKDIIGKSGKVTINITMNNTDAHTVTVNGKNMTMYNPMIVVGGISLSEAKFQNITVKNGKTIGDGSKQYAVLVGFPGINDSLGLSDLKSESSDGIYDFEDNFSISADVTDFELGNFMFSAIPISSLDIGLNSISTSMDDVRSNLSKLQTISKSLQSINADSLLNSLTSNPDKLTSLSSLVEQASKLYDNNKALIDVLNKYTTADNMKTIQALCTYIEGADIDGLQSALDVLNSVFGNDASAEKIQQGMTLLKEMSSDLSNPDVKSAIANLPQTVSTLSSLQTAINENKDLIEVLKTLSQSNVLQSISSSLSGVEGSLAAGSLSKYAKLTGNADAITSKMTAWIELGKNYKIFTKVSDNMTSSVMFIYKVDGLKSASTSESSKSNTVETTTQAESENGISGFFKKIFKK
jgi:hypothetical protein